MNYVESKEIAQLKLKYPLFKAAHDLAMEVHGPVMRKGRGDVPYMYHIDEVVMNSIRYSEDLLGPDVLDEETLITIAALHDAFEDFPDTCSLQRIKNVLAAVTGSVVSAEELDYIIEGIDAISKREHPGQARETYDAYVVRVLCHIYASIVKLGDLEHNMSDLQPGGRRGKYELTKFVLLSRFAKSDSKCSITLR